jgi:hypothetical protein
MFYLLVILGVLSMAIGVFVVGFGVPVRETSFGAGLLVAGTVAITAGFILVGLAATVAELRRVAQALKQRAPNVPRPLRPVERSPSERGPVERGPAERGPAERGPVERKDGMDRRPGPPRGAQMPPPGPDLPPLSANVGSPVPPPQQSKLGVPDLSAAPPLEPRKPGPDWLRRAIAEIESTPESTRGAATAPEHAREDQHDARPRPSAPPPSFPAAAAEQPEPPPRGGPPPMQNIFDKVWPNDRRRDSAPEKRAEPSLDQPLRPPEPRSPAPPPSRAGEPRSAPSAPARSEPRPTILKSGVIDEMAYTLFTDGSIEAQMPDGTMRFASIEELRAHLENHDG